MTVAELRKALEGLPDDLEVAIEPADWPYIRVARQCRYTYGEELREQISPTVFNPDAAFVIS